MSGTTPISKISETVFRHTIGSAGLKEWTLKWEEKASINPLGNIAPRKCEANTKIDIPAPLCGTIISSSSPNPLLWGDKVTLRARFDPAQADAPYTYNVLTNVHSSLTACLGDIFTTDGETCTLPWVAGSPKEYDWNIKWKTTDKTCSAVVNNLCSWSNTLTAINRPSFMKTTNGFSYIRTLNNQPYFNVSTPDHDHFSTNIFGSNNANAIDQNPPCNGTAIHCTESKYLLLGYADSNSVSNPTTWYAYLKGKIAANLNTNFVDWGGAKNLGAVMGSSSLSDTAVNVINVDGDFSATGQCHGANIFLINGSLNITPDLSIVNTTTDACLFIVRNTTSVLKSTKSSRVCTGNHIDYTENAIPRDDVRAYIITSNFTTSKSEVQLFVKGGVITNTFTGGLNRNVNSDSCLLPYLPSEIVDYEGARYIKAFRDILGDSAMTSIREIQYTGRN
jgi:hypothetical protein